MTLYEFESAAAKAMKKLPREFRARLNNVVVTVKDAPTRAQTARFGAGLLGLYEGVPLPDRGAAYSGAMPDKITLFRKNLEKAGGSENLEDRIRHTLMHEIAHHFGMGDDELLRKGLY
jgi:predicted Zn-dependent protease with MMP-like domain